MTANGTRTLRVLYAEDDPSNRLVVKRNLEFLGLEVVVAADGEEALRRCREESFDLVLLDLHMPDLEGDQVMERARPLQPQARFAVLTSDDERRAVLLRAGFDAVRIKPMRMESYAGFLEELGLVKR
ncbi:MAG: response regulator [Desulfovibrionaceae bacterium]